MMQEKKVTWKNGKLIGEGLWVPSDGKLGVVISHPHPQMGGSMYNNVVEAIRDAYAAAGFSTLRFNFRGVEGSSGNFDNGQGERNDVLSACQFLKQQGIEKISFAGYSFGAWIGSFVLRENIGFFESAVMVSPPDKFMSFDWSGLKGSVDLMICGEIDPFCNVRALKEAADRINARFIVLKSVDHFFGGHESQLADALILYLNEKNKKI